MPHNTKVNKNKQTAANNFHLKKAVTIQNATTIFPKLSILKGKTNIGVLPGKYTVGHGFLLSPCPTKNY